MITHAVLMLLVWYICSSDCLIHKKFQLNVVNWTVLNQKQINFIYIQVYISRYICHVPVILQPCSV